jgi:ABC-type Zn uptake system ZnuABC Zn-binding protein ZnuA
MKILFLCIAFIYASAGVARPPQEVISCTHVQVCNAIQFVIGTDAKYKVKNLIDTQHEDPHHFEPSVGDIKSLMRAKLLVLPPLTLQPWLKGIKNKRQSPSKTYVLEEKNGHFWLDYTSLCSIINQIATFLPTPHLSITDSCKNTKKSLLSAKLNKNIFILLHNSMGNYFKELELEYFALKGHGHHEKYSAKSLKKVLKIKKKNKNIVWIYEKQIPVPNSLSNYVSKDDTIIKINTLGRLGTSPFEVLNQLNKELGKL